MIEIKSGKSPIDVEIKLSASKSITNRALIIQALSREKIEIRNPSTSDDSRILTNALQFLTKEIDAGDSGTAFRFLTAFLSIQQGEFFLTGSNRMKDRPIGTLVKALSSLHAKIEFLGKQGYPPLKITGNRLHGGSLRIEASTSSQFVSALLMIAPVLSGGLTLELTGSIVSRPYIDMTKSMMLMFGIEISELDNVIQILPQQYTGGIIEVENDWSSASFWYEVVALAENANIKLRDLHIKSIQGDSVISKIMENLGVRSTHSTVGIKIKKDSMFKKPPLFSWDFTNCPDLVMPIAAACVGLQLEARLSGISNLRIKESDRIFALKNEIEKTGSIVCVGENELKISAGNSRPASVQFNSHNDHRIVMALAPLALVFESITIDDEKPVSKSYPEFWNDLLKAGFQITIT